MYTYADPNPHCGPFDDTPIANKAKHQSGCNCCEKNAAHIEWKDSVCNSSTWFFLECHTCEAEICTECCDIAEDTGFATCINCISEEIRKGK